MVNIQRTTSYRACILFSDPRRGSFLFSCLLFLWPLALLFYLFLLDSSFFFNSGF